MIFVMIFGMGLIVFLNRYLFLEPRLPVRLRRPGYRIADRFMNFVSL